MSFENDLTKSNAIFSFFTIFGKKIDLSAMINELLSNRISEITHVLKENKVKRAYAFGSICTDKFNKDSDVDLLISFEDNLDPITYAQNYFKIVELTEHILNRKVDLITERSLKNPYFIKVMNKTKTLIYD